MRNRKAINLIARNGKAMFGELEDLNRAGIDLAAKAVILAEYGEQVWSDVRDYAKAHPQIVEFINEYPMLVVSLVETGKVATMNAQTSDKAIFVTDIIANNASDELWMDYYLVNDSSGTTWGSTQGWQSNIDAFLVALYASNGNFWYHNAGGYRNAGVSRKSQVGKWLTQYITKSKCGLVGIDESNLGNGAIGTFTGNYPVKLELQDNVQMKEAIMKRNGTNLIHLVPAADNVMVDIARYIAIHNTGNGIATIQITDKAT